MGRAEAHAVAPAAQHSMPRVSTLLAGTKQLPALLVQVQHCLGWAVAHAMAAPAARPGAIQLRRLFGQDQRGQLLCSRPGGRGTCCSKFTLTAWKDTCAFSTQVGGHHL